MTPTEHLEKQQALVKQFAEILEFVLKFDEHKVLTFPILKVYSVVTIYSLVVFTIVTDDNSSHPKRFQLLPSYGVTTEFVRPQ